MSVIVQTAWRSYGPCMAATAITLLTLLALVVMPFGMGGGPASAQSMPAEHSSAPSGHCDQQSGQDEVPVKSPQLMHCAMCLALPAAETPGHTVALIPVAPRTMAPVASFNGIELEIATPPPKRG